MASGLKIHLRTHLGENQFPCSQCTNTFSQKGNLKKHLKTHSAEKPFPCNNALNHSQSEEIFSNARYDPWFFSLIKRDPIDEDVFESIFEVCYSEKYCN